MTVTTQYTQTLFSLDPHALTQSLSRSLKYKHKHKYTETIGQRQYLQIHLPRFSNTPWHPSCMCPSVSERDDTPPARVYRSRKQIVPLFTIVFQSYNIPFDLHILLRNYLFM